MHSILPILSLLALVGTGIVAGLLFAFSNFVMQALCLLPPEVGMRAMQRINERILNGLFLTIFLGTAVCSLVVAALCSFRLGDSGVSWLLAGALAYLLGPFLVTVARNVPLNNELARAESKRAAAVWPDYVSRWMRWNHVRVVLAVVALGCLGIGLWRIHAP